MVLRITYSFVFILGGHRFREIYFRADPECSATAPQDSSIGHRSFNADRWNAYLEQRSAYWYVNLPSCTSRTQSGGFTSIGVVFSCARVKGRLKMK